MEGVRLRIGAAIFRSCMARFYAMSRRFQSRNSAGITRSVNTVAVTIPPIIGAAMRRMTSEPVPDPHMIGNRPSMIVSTVISFGRRRSSAPSVMLSRTSASASARPLSAAAATRRTQA